MNNYPIPDDAYLVPGRDDRGRRVIINSEKCFKNEPGEVLHGPYQYPYRFKTKAKKGKKTIWVEKRGTSIPNWYIRLDSYGRAFHFVAEEISDERPLQVPQDDAPAVVAGDTI